MPMNGMANRINYNIWKNEMAWHDLMAFSYMTIKSRLIIKPYKGLNFANNTGNKLKLAINAINIAKPVNKPK